MSTLRLWFILGLLSVGMVHGFGPPADMWHSFGAGQGHVLAILDSRSLLRFSQRWALMSAQADQQRKSREVVPYDIVRGGFVSSGWMGDGEKQGGFSTNMSRDNPHNSSSSQRWIYRPQGAGWGAIAYQFPGGNWGDKEGRNLSGKGYRELSVWARGVPDKDGRYPVIQFKAGGGSNPAKKYQASFEVAEGDIVTLTEGWKRYTVSLGKDLSSVISAFTFVLRSDDNPNGATFFLSEIEYR